MTEQYKNELDALIAFNRSQALHAEAEGRDADAAFHWAQHQRYSLKRWG